MTLWLEAHLLVAVSYVVFRLVERGTPRGRTRGAQAVFLLALALPPLLALLPAKQLPPIPLVGGALPALVDRIAPRRPAPPRTEGAAVAGADVVVSRGAPDLAFLAGLALALAALFSLVRLCLRFRALHRCLAETLPLRRIGRVVVAVSPVAAVPFSTRAGGRAWVVLPESLGASASDFRVAILHELEHHRRGDTRWAFAVEWIAALGFPNPFFSLWKRRIEELQEYSCDEALVGRGRIGPHVYGSCLVRVAEAALGSRFHPVGTTGMGAGPGNPKQRKSQLRRRVEMLSQHTTMRRRSGAVLAGTLAAAVVSLAAYGAHQARTTQTASDRVKPGTVDFDPLIQKIAQKALAAAIERHGALAGFAVVSDPHTGRLLAVANSDRRKWMNPEGPWSLGMRVEPRR